MNRKEVIYIYPKDKNGNKIGNTIAVLLKDGAMFFGEAVCSANDQFSRKVGRALATERAEQQYQRYLARQKD